MPVLIRYSEIALKGKKTRSRFERILKENVEKQTGGKAVRKQARIILYGGNWEKLAFVFGVKSFSPADEMPATMERIKEACLKAVKGETFAVRAQRVTKDFPKTSMEINREVGAYIVEKTGKKVDLSNPETEVGVEIVGKKAYVFTERFEGPGGLPYGASGKAVALMSTGYDSPVAAWLGAKRGLEIIFVHFENKSRKVFEKIKEKLEEYFPKKAKAYIFPHREILAEIASKVEKKYVCLACKGVMYSLASKVAEKEGAKCVITGENVGQVASQTVDNIYFLDKFSDVPVIRPLAFMDKEDIINLAKKIGTYGLSGSSSCPFAPKHPATRGPGRERAKIMKVAEEVADAYSDRAERI